MADMRMIESSPEYRKWHSATVELVLSHKSKELAQHTELLSSRITQSILGFLSIVATVDLSSSAVKSFEAITSQCIATSRLFRVQVSEYRTYLPCDEKFDANVMEKAGEDDEDAETQDAVLVISPCVEKITDESGQNLRSPLPIVKARVICLRHRLKTEE
jgi:hypothetical protein